ncbi:Exopolyphosphatase [Nymphaea thermarum]|nr:Exopolyphosphatase [Nymphaea thermarum]
MNSLTVINADPAKLLAAVDMGTNSFKMVVVRAEPDGKFLPVHRHKERVRLGNAEIGPELQKRTINSLKNFLKIAGHHGAEVKFVATSAVRDAKNKRELLVRIEQETGVDVRVLSGEEEAQLTYFGVLQFLPVYDRTVLVVDIGGGSTEFLIGKQGKAFFATSLKLGHVVLTELFVKNEEIESMRQYIRSTIAKSGLIERVDEIKFEIAVGASGTIRSIRNAVRKSVSAPGWEGSRNWRFSAVELRELVEKLLVLGGDGIQTSNPGFSWRRSEFILAGSLILLEIFELLKIDEMEVSEFALGEGVIAETLGTACKNYDVNANIRWNSVARLATRSYDKKRMTRSVQSAEIAKEIFEGMRNCSHIHKVDLLQDKKNLEYLEAAVLLHATGLLVGKKGYHRHSYHIIKNCDHLQGFDPREIEIIASVVRYHRKWFPGLEDVHLHRLPRQVQYKVRALAVMARVAIAIQCCQCFKDLEITCTDEGYKLGLRVSKDQVQSPSLMSQVLSTVEKDLHPELELFGDVFKLKMVVTVSWNP